MDPASDARALTVAYIEAVGAKRFDRVAELLHPDMELHQPGKTMRGAEAYVSVLRRLGSILVRNEIRETVVDGNDVCVVYDFVTDTPAGAVPSAEWITVDGGRIRSVRLMFQREQWPEVLAELARRAAVLTP